MRIQPRGAGALLGGALDVVGLRPLALIHETAVVDAGCQLGQGTRVWHFCHLSAGAVVGDDCSFGQNCFVASGVRVGDRVRVQNNVSLYDGVIIEDDVFLGPSCVLTNVVNPRAEIDRRGQFETTRIRRGATVGANATIVCGVTIGRYAFVGAGAVVVRDVADYELVLGVPAARAGYMSRHGARLEFHRGLARCPASGLRYELDATGAVRCLEDVES